MYPITYFPNRVRTAYSANNTSWAIIATDGTGYASYALLVAAGKTPFPGAPTDFPLGLPNMLVRNVNQAGTGDGGTVAVITNTLQTPSAEDDLLAGSGQTLIYQDECVKSVWVKKTTGTDQTLLTGFF